MPDTTQDTTDTALDDNPSLPWKKYKESMEQYEHYLTIYPQLTWARYLEAVNEANDPNGRRFWNTNIIMTRISFSPWARLKRWLRS